MPVVTVGGEKKKVACGPCIRGHRSSKCAHKDRVLIEVRKPGRPLGTCPHPTGSCGCERVVINYMIPKDRTGPLLPQGLSPASAASSRVQKSTVTARSVAALPQATVDKVLSGDTSALAVLSQYPSETISSSSDTSSLPPSASSSASATPRIDAVQSGPDPKAAAPYEDHATHSMAQRNGSISQRPLKAKKETSVVESRYITPSKSKSCCCSQPADEAEEKTTIPAPAAVSATAAHVPPHAASQQPSFMELQSASQDFTHQGMSYDFAGMEPMSVADFPSYEFDIGCGGMNPPANTISQRLMASEMADCACGDTCQCFACITHPRNRTTVDYVRYHNELQSHASLMGTTYGPSPMFQSQRSMYNAATQYNMSPKSTNAYSMDSDIRRDSTASQSHMQWPAAQPQSAMNMMPQTPVSELENMHLPLYSTAFSPSLITAESPMGSAQAFDSATLGHAVSSTAGSNFGGTLAPHTPHRILPSQLSTSLLDMDSAREDDASTLSPSSFLLQQFTVPGCDDMTGTCQCGEGCSCPGCLTHSGHGDMASHQFGSSGEQVQGLVEVKTEQKGSCCS